MIVYCAAIDCKYHNKSNKCTAKRINLTDHSVMTVWEGRQRFARCQTYEMAEDYKSMADVITKLLEVEHG